MDGKLIKQFPFWGPPDIKPPRVWENLWNRAMEYAEERAKEEDEHDEDKVFSWWEHEYELLCAASGVEPYN